MDKSEAPVDATADVEAKIEQQGGLPPGMCGTDAAMAVLCVLAQRLSGGEARDEASSSDSAKILESALSGNGAGERAQ
jgi:hypothetical protein